MIMTWQRHLFYELIKVFLLVLFGFFLLYNIIDYSLHMQDFIVDKRIHIPHLILYYTSQFIKRATLLMPLALLVATLKVLFTMHNHGELIALQASGIGLNKILRPFFFLALLCTVITLVNTELILPHSLNYLDQFREDHFKHSYRGQRKEPIHAIQLHDHSKVIYQKEDKERQEWINVFWIRSADEVWRIQTVAANPEAPLGRFVDQLKRNAEGNFEKVASFDTYPLPLFTVDETNRKSTGGIPLENKSLSALFYLTLHPHETSAYESPEILSQFLFKLLVPFTSFLVVLGATPFCLSYKRTQPTFLTYSIALFSFIGFFALLDAAVILGENLILSPYIALGIPVGCIILFFTYHYRRRIVRYQ